MKLIWVFWAVMLAFFSPAAQAQDVSYRKSTILAYDFGNFRILENDTLNPEAVQRFLEKYPARRFSTRQFIAR